MSNEPLLIPIAEVVKLLSISKSAFYELRSSGRIPLQPVRLTKKPLYNREEVSAWVSSGCPANWQAKGTT